MSDCGEGKSWRGDDLPGRIGWTAEGVGEVTDEQEEEKSRGQGQVKKGQRR